MTRSQRDALRKLLEEATSINQVIWDVWAELPALLEAADRAEELEAELAEALAEGRRQAFEEVWRLFDRSPHETFLGALVASRVRALAAKPGGEGIDLGGGVRLEPAPPGGKEGE